MAAHKCTQEQAVKWLCRGVAFIGVAATLMLTVVGWAFASSHKQSSRMDEVERRQAAAGVNDEWLKKSLNDILSRLDRMEDKLDKNGKKTP